MKHEEAAGLLQPMDCEEPEVQDLKEAVRMAAEALSKRVPMIIKSDEEIVDCPSCGKYTMYHGGVYYCEKCGQALEWEA